MFSFWIHGGSRVKPEIGPINHSRSVIVQGTNQTPRYCERQELAPGLKCDIILIQPTAWLLIGWPFSQQSHKSRRKVATNACFEATATAYQSRIHTTISEGEACDPSVQLASSTLYSRPSYIVTNPKDVETMRQTSCLTSDIEVQPIPPFLHSYSSELGIKYLCTLRCYERPR